MLSDTPLGSITCYDMGEMMNDYALLSLVLLTTFALYREGLKDTPKRVVNACR